MSSRILFVTGTDTGVGKTILTVALTRHWVKQGADVVSLKPFCSGGRSDAADIRRALGGRLDLDEINPWHFKAALAPRIAATIEGRRVSRREILAHVRAIAARHAITIVEGAGGLLSPLAADLDARQLIASLRAIPVVVCPNRLGAINQTLLVLHALPRSAANQARVVLMSQRRPDNSAPSNVAYLRGELGSLRVIEFPWLSPAERKGLVKPGARLRHVLDVLAES